MGRTWNSLSATKLERKLQRLPPSTPEDIIHWDSGLQLMKCRIVEKKLLFLRKTMERDESNITRRVLLMGLEGLGHECKQVTDMLGLPNIMFNLVSKGEIKNAIARISKRDMKEDMLNSRKVWDSLTANPMDNAYMTYMSLPKNRIL